MHTRGMGYDGVVIGYGALAAVLVLTHYTTDARPPAVTDPPK